MRRRQPTILLIASAALLASACQSQLELTVRRQKHPLAKGNVASGLSRANYKSILILPPERRPQAGGSLMSDGLYDTLTSNFSRSLLQFGFRVISPDVVARIEARLSQKKKDTARGRVYSVAEKALIMGKETNADAILVVSDFSIRPFRRRYAWDPVGNMMRHVGSEWSNALPDQWECTLDFKFARAHLEAKLIDVASGSILWIGNATNRTPNLLRRNWNGVITEGDGKSCMIEAQTFDLRGYATNATTLERQVRALVGAVATQLRTQIR